MNAAVFLDRDGTLIEDRDYLSDPRQVVFLPGAIEALRRLQDAGFKLILVTNQSGVGRGKFTMAEVDRVHRHMEEAMQGQGVRIDNIYVAPEAPDQPSRGRKPSPESLFDAREQFQIDLTRSYMIGDKQSDLECGWSAGVGRSILVRTGYGSETEKALGENAVRAWVVDDLMAAADVILAEQRQQGVEKPAW